MNVIMDDLNRKTLVELKELCREKNLQTSGAKRILVQRLKEYFREQNESNDGNNDQNQTNQMQNETNDGNQQRRRRRSNGGDNISVHSDLDDDIDEVQRRPIRKSKFSFKDIEESLEKFDGDNEKNIKQWVDDFEAQSDVFGWDDLEKLVYGRRLLAGSAKLYASCELKPKTWYQLKSGLIKEFEIKVNSALIH